MSKPIYFGQDRDIDYAPVSNEKLPRVSASDDGDVLTVVDGAWKDAQSSGGGGIVIIEATYTPDTPDEETPTT